MNTICVIRQKIPGIYAIRRVLTGPPKSMRRGIISVNRRIKHREIRLEFSKKISYIAEKWSGYFDKQVQTLFVHF